MCLFGDHWDYDGNRTHMSPIACYHVIQSPISHETGDRRAQIRPESHLTYISYEQYCETSHQETKPRAVQVSVARDSCQHREVGIIIASMEVRNSLSESRSSDVGLVRALRPVFHLVRDCRSRVPS